MKASGSNSILKKKIAAISILAVLCLAFNNCTKTDSAAVDGNNDVQSTYSAWNPPLGDVIQGGVTTFDGWSTPRLVAVPVNLSGLGGWTDSVAVSRSGTNLYFGYTKNDYYIFESRLVLQPTGPARTSENSSDAFQIFQAKLSNTGFSVSYHSANPGVSTWAASAAVDAAESLMAYTTFQFSPYQTQIFLAQNVGGNWQQLGAFASPVNGSGHCDDDNAFIIGTLQSGTVYFESKRSDLAGTTCGARIRLYYATVTNGVLSSAQEVPGVNGSGAGSSDVDTQIAVSEDKQKVYWTSIRSNTYGLYTADWSGSTFANVRPMMLANTFTAPFANKVVRIGEASVAELSEGFVMYFMCGIAMSDGPSGPENIQMRICFSKRTK